MSQASGAGPRGTRAANSGPQTVRSNPTPRDGPTRPIMTVRMETSDKSAGPGGVRDVAPNEPIYKAVSSCVMVALSLMRSDKGKYRLPTTGEDVFKYVREPQRRTCTTSFGLQAWADDFVTQLSQRFVGITITNRTNPKAANGSDMWFERHDWKTWTPRNSGTMFLSDFVGCCHTSDSPTQPPFRVIEPIWMYGAC